MELKDDYSISFVLNTAGHKNLVLYKENGTKIVDSLQSADQSYNEAYIANWVNKTIKELGQKKDIPENKTAEEKIKKCIYDAVKKGYGYFNIDNDFQLRATFDQQKVSYRFEVWEIDGNQVDDSFYLSYSNLIKDGAVIKQTVATIKGWMYKIVNGEEKESEVTYLDQKIKMVIDQTQIQGNSYVKIGDGIFLTGEKYLKYDYRFKLVKPDMKSGKDIQMGTSKELSEVDLGSMYKEYTVLKIREWIKDILKKEKNTKSTTQTEKYYNHALVKDLISGVLKNKTDHIVSGNYTVYGYLKDNTTVEIFVYDDKNAKHALIGSLEKENAIGDEFLKPSFDSYEQNIDWIVNWINDKIEEYEHPSYTGLEAQGSSIKLRDITEIVKTKKGSITLDKFIVNSSTPNVGANPSEKLITIVVWERGNEEESVPKKISEKLFNIDDPLGIVDITAFANKTIKDYTLKQNPNHIPHLGSENEKYMTEYDLKQLYYITEPKKKILMPDDYYITAEEYPNDEDYRIIKITTKDGTLVGQQKTSITKDLRSTVKWINDTVSKFQKDIEDFQKTGMLKQKKKDDSDDLKI